MEVYYFQIASSQSYLEVKCNGQQLILEQDRNTVNRDQFVYLNSIQKEDDFKIEITQQLLKITYQDSHDEYDKFVQLQIDQGDKQETLQIAVQRVYQIYQMEPYIYVLSDRGIFIFNTQEMYLCQTLIFDKPFGMQIVNFRKEAFLTTIGSTKKVQMFTKFLYIYKNIQIIESKLNFKAFIIHESDANDQEVFDDENTQKIQYQEILFVIPPTQKIQKFLEHDLNIESQIVEINSYEKDDDCVVIRLYLYIKIKSESTQTYAIQYDIRFQSLLDIAKSQAEKKQINDSILKDADVLEYKYQYIQTNSFLTSIPSNNQGDVYIYDLERQQVLKFI